LSSPKETAVARANRAFDAVFVGAVTLDAIALVDGFPRPDERVLAAEVMYAGGGPAATAAVAAARLGVTTAFVGSVGDDADGQAILEGLAAEGVDISGVAVSPETPSAASVIIVDRGQGTRAICTRPSSKPDLADGLDLLAEAPIVHTDHLGWAPVVQSGRLRSGQLLSVDAGNPIPGFTPKGAGIYAPTVDALRRSYGDAEIDTLLDHALADGCSTVVATEGAHGSWAATAAGERAYAPAHPIDILSTLGAGDVFHGALVAAVVRELPLHTQLAFANVTAALSCRGLDGRSRIPTIDEVRDALPVAAQ
jgi:sulfofructose kinase